MSAGKTLAKILASFAIVLLFCSQAPATEEKSGIEALSGLAEKAGAIAESGNLGELFNINEVSSDVLAQIPGLGENLSKAITAYRDANGPFTQIKDLLNVEGIDATLLEKIKPFLKI